MENMGKHFGDSASEPQVDEDYVLEQEVPLNQ